MGMQWDGGGHLGHHACNLMGWGAHLGHHACNGMGGGILAITHACGPGPISRHVRVYGAEQAVGVGGLGLGLGLGLG